MPPRPIGAAIGAALREPKPKKTLPKIVKRFTTGKGDRFILTSVTKDSPLSKDTTLTLYKEIILAKGLKSYQKLEEKIVARTKNAIRTIEKNIFDKKGEQTGGVNFFENTFFSNTPDMYASVKRELYSGESRYQVGFTMGKNHDINVNNLRPEVKRLFKLLGEGKLNNLFFK